jgi:hypothetical protein
LYSGSLLFTPSAPLIPIDPLFLLIAQPTLNFLYRLGIACILPDIIADLDSWSITCSGKLDNDVQRNRLLGI